MAMRLDARSDTGAMSDIFEARSAAVKEYVDALQPTADHVGAVFLLDEVVIGMDLFGAPATCRVLLSKIVRGYALDAIDREVAHAAGENRLAVSRPDHRARAGEFVAAALAAPRTAFPAVGVGKNWPGGLRPLRRYAGLRRVCCSPLGVSHDGDGRLPPLST